MTNNPIQGQTNRILGYPVDARLLITNADDFGMCHATNQAVLLALQEGLIRSTTLMVPCPWALHAMHNLSSHPEIAFGIHLTVISEWADYRWGPVTPREKVPSLIDEKGNFHNFEDVHAQLELLKLDELEREFRGQIEIVLAAGLQPTHLDWHALRFGNRIDIFDLMIRLAKEYGLAQRLIGSQAIEKLQSQGLPTVDYNFLDSYGLDTSTKPAHYAQLLHELPAGLSEWAIHPGLETSELTAIEHDDRHVRQTDFDFWTSQLAKEIIKTEGIILLDYRTLQAAWKEINGKMVQP